MPLRLQLLPRQRALIGTTWVRNGGARTLGLLIETDTTLVRDKYMIDPDEVDTTARELQFTILTMYVSDRPGEHRDRFEDVARRAKADLPDHAETVCDIALLVERGDLYGALKLALALVQLDGNGRLLGATREGALAREAGRTRKVELAPAERLVIGRAIVRNGDTRARLAIDADAIFIQGKHLLPPGAATTPCRRLYLVMQDMCMADDPAGFADRFDAAAHDVIRDMPGAVPTIVGIGERARARRYLQALAAGRELIAAEAEFAEERAATPPVPTPPVAAGFRKTADASAISQQSSC